jgi:hypothetical protein
MRIRPDLADATTRAAVTRDGRREGDDIRLIYLDSTNQSAFAFLHIIIAVAPERIALVTTTRWDDWQLDAAAAENSPAAAQLAQRAGE